MNGRAFVIEKGIPFPPESYRHKNGCRGGNITPGPWPDMEVGDSWLAPTLNAAQLGREWGRRHGRRFVIEKRTESERGWRIWRKS